MNINKIIETKGYYEQEKQFLFPGLYGNNAVTKNTKGMYINFHRELLKRDKLGNKLKYSTY